MREMSDNNLQVLSRITVEDEAWAKTPTATPIEAALSVGLMDKAWPLIEHQLRIQILADTWPFLVQHASTTIDDEQVMMPEELQDSILNFAEDQFSQRLWEKIGGSFAPHLAKAPEGAFQVGQSFQLKVSVPKLQQFAFEVGPIVVPKSSYCEGAVIRETEISIQAELSDDIELSLKV